MPKARRSPRPWKAPTRPNYVLRRSRVHGRGIFAARDIDKGEVIDEFTGDRITYAQADERHKDRDLSDNHTFLFTLDHRTVIDSSVGGNDTRFINHKCEPNCAPRIRGGRVFIVATKPIEKGEEIGYEYHIAREDDDPENVDEIYACRCGSPRCRGTILWPPKRPAPRKRKSARAKEPKRASGR